MTVAQADDVLVVPNEVINASTDGDFVYIVEDGVIKIKPVELGTVSVTHTEIKSGLKEGDKVVNDLNADIKRGMKAIAVEKKEDQCALPKKEKRTDYGTILEYVKWRWVISVSTKVVPF